MIAQGAGTTSGIPGDPGAIRAQACQLRAASTEGERALTQVDDGRDTALRGWQGAAADAFDEHADSLRKDIDTLIELGSQAAAPLETYAEALEAAQAAYSRAHAAKVTAENNAAEAKPGSDNQQQYQQDASDAGRAMDGAYRDAVQANRIAAAKISKLVPQTLAEALKQGYIDGAPLTAVSVLGKIENQKHANARKRFREQTRKWMYDEDKKHLTKEAVAGKAPQRTLAAKVAKFLGSKKGTVLTSIPGFLTAYNKYRDEGMSELDAFVNAALKTAVSTVAGVAAGAAVGALFAEIPVVGWALGIAAGTEVGSAAGWAYDTYADDAVAKAVPDADIAHWPSRARLDVDVPGVGAH